MHHASLDTASPLTRCPMSGGRHSQQLQDTGHRSWRLPHKRSEKRIPSQWRESGRSRCPHLRWIAINVIKSNMDRRITISKQIDHGSLMQRTILLRRIVVGEEAMGIEMRMSTGVMDLTGWSGSLAFTWGRSSAPDVNHCVFACLSCGRERAGMWQGYACYIIGVTGK